MMMKLNSKQNIAILFGGRSAEHEISILTGLQILHALDADKFNSVPVYLDEQGKWWTGKQLFNKDFYKNINFKKLKKFNFSKAKIDVYFPAFHGTFGEDGCIQGFFELANVPYAGPCVEAAAIAMNKAMTKQICIANNIPVLKYALLDRKNWDIKDVALELPLFIKPNHLGSSIGVSSAKNKHELQLAIAGGFIFDDQVIIEPQIKNLLEINCSVFDNQVSEVEEPQRDAEILSFEQKYLKGKKGKMAGMASMQRVINPKSISQEQKTQIQNYTKKIYKILDGSGVWRIDYLIDKDKNQIYLNEINPIPGSLAYYLWTNMTLTELINKLINSAIKRHNYKNQSRRNLAKKIFV